MSTRSDIQEFLWHLPDGREYCVQKFQSGRWVFSPQWKPLYLNEALKQAESFKGEERRVVRVCRYTYDLQDDFPIAQCVIKYFVAAV